MATIKSYTDLEQSKKLAEILPLESADMWYSYYGNTKYNPTIAYKGQQWFLCQIRNSLHDDIPCWSLAALLDVLPEGTNVIKDESDTENEHYMCTVGIKDDIISTFGNNSVDACVDMIEKLYEMNLL